MKFCLNCGQDKEYRDKADVLYIPYDSINMCDTIIETYPDKMFILDIPKNQTIDWQLLYNMNILSRKNLICCIEDLQENAEQCKKYELAFFWKYPVSSFFDLRSLIEVGASYARLEAPIFFQMDKVKELPIKIICSPDIVSYTSIPRKEEGIYGIWIRPEDLHLYEEYIDIITFESKISKPREQALYRIYAEDKKWPGPLKDIVYGLDSEAVNRMIFPDKMTSQRIRCRQRCMNPGGICSLCHDVLSLANPEKIRAYAEHFDLEVPNKPQGLTLEEATADDLEEMKEQLVEKYSIGTEYTLEQVDEALKDPQVYQAIQDMLVDGLTVEELMDTIHQHEGGLNSLSQDTTDQT